MDELNAFEYAQQLFADYNLPMPPVPLDIRDQLVVLFDWLFGTREDTPSPYRLTWFVDDFLANDEPEYLLFGHDGEGINSYAMHYYLVRGPLALFLQIGWGGAYMDNEESRAKMAAHFTQAYDLIEWLDIGLSKGIISPQERFVVVHSDFYSTQFARMTHFQRNQLSPSSPPEWYTNKDALMLAWEQIRDLVFGDGD
jgi:hypothetical protein